MTHDRADHCPSRRRPTRRRPTCRRPTCRRPTCRLGRLAAGLAVAAVALAGCTNPYREAYVHLAGDPGTGPAGGLTAEPLAAAAPPEAFLSEDLTADGLDLLERGYVCIGRAVFLGPRASVTEALEQATDVGAEIVLVSRAYVDTIQDVVTRSRWRAVGSYHCAGGHGHHHHGLDYVIVEEPVVFTYDRYYHGATFWAPCSPPPRGMHLRDLTLEERRRLGSNRGAVLMAAIRGMPAFEADLVPGDVIRAIDGAEISGAEDLRARLRIAEGRAVTLRIARPDVTIDRLVGP